MNKDILTRFNQLTNFEKFVVVATTGCVVVNVVKGLTAISKYRNASHERLSTQSVDPQQYLFPNFFKNKDGLWLFRRNWLLPQGSTFKKPRGLVIICHGAAEHIQRYEHVANALNNAGFIAFGMDHQGHGMSEGDRSHVKKFDDLIDDFSEFCQTIKKENPKLCTFVIGHSMGGLIAAITAYRQPKLFDGGVVLSGPFFGPSRGTKPDVTIPLVRWTLESLSSLLPKLPVVAIDNTALSHDPSIKYHLQQDPLHHTGKMTIRAGTEILHAAEAARELFYKIEYPFYIFGGADDTLSDTRLWDDFYEKAKTPTKLKLKHVFSGLFHETLNETESQQKDVLNKMLNWLLLRCKEMDNE